MFSSGILLGNGCISCSECGYSFNRSKQKWLQHVKSVHPKTFDQLADQQRRLKETNLMFDRHMEQIKNSSNEEKQVNPIYFVKDEMGFDKYLSVFLLVIVAFIFPSNRS